MKGPGLHSKSLAGRCCYTSARLQPFPALPNAHPRCTFVLPFDPHLIPLLYLQEVALAPQPKYWLRGCNWPCMVHTRMKLYVSHFVLCPAASFLPSLVIHQGKCNLEVQRTDKTYSSLTIFLFFLSHSLRTLWDYLECWGRTFLH